MLNSMQRDIIRTGYNAAKKTGDEAALQQRVQKLAKDFHVSEDDIRNVVAGVPAGTSSSFPPIVAAQEIAKHRGRREWTSEEIRQMEQLRGEGKGPMEISKALGCDVRRVQSKLHNMKKGETQAQPAGKAPGTPEPAGTTAAPALESEKEIPAPKPSVAEPTPAGPQEASPIAPSEISEEVPAPGEYSALRAKLAEPEAPGINLMRELLDLMDRFELAYSARIGTIQARPAAGWAACSFEVGNRQYTVSLRRRED